jgi:hypothetical protein
LPVLGEIVTRISRRLTQINADFLSVRVRSGNRLDCRLQNELRMVTRIITDFDRQIFWDADTRRLEFTRINLPELMTCS